MGFIRLKGRDEGANNAPRLFLRRIKPVVRYRVEGFQQKRSSDWKYAPRLSEKCRFPWDS